MKSTSYSEKVLDHFRAPRNVGTMKEDPSVAKGRIGNPVCGDMMEFYIKVKDGIIEDIKFQTFGCGSAVATASMITELAKGKTLEEAEKITRNDVADELDGLPPVKMHCSNLAADALRDAIKAYREQQGQRPEVPEKPEAPACEIRGEKEFTGKGVFHEVGDPQRFQDLRILVVNTGADAVNAAIALTERTPRVVLMTRDRELILEEDLVSRLHESSVKVLYESELLEIQGLGSVEKVRILDLNEDTEYELFIDAVLLI